MSARAAPTRSGRNSIGGLLAVVATALPLAGCDLGSGLSCNNRDMKASISAAALASLVEANNGKGLPEVTARDRSEFRLHDVVETGREGDVLTCEGMIGMMHPQPGLIDFPISYNVARSGDGNILYTFDEERFGTAYMGLMMVTGMAEAAKRHRLNSAAPSHAAPAAARPAMRPAPTPYAADPNWSQFRD